MMTFATAAPEPSICIRRPVDMARLLVGAAPGRASDYARMAHERACDDDDVDAAVFWCEVMLLLV